ncbi:MAG: hypothetical protein JRJ85_01335 [Deltaproteobacteria bacterium]|nr:hypothetical protein [Deltaproteobacteria bacterium]
MKKKVLILRLLDQAGLESGKAEGLREDFIRQLKTDDHLLLQKGTDDISSTANPRSPQLGIVIEPDLAKKAEEMGVNILVTMVLHPFEVRLNKLGVWPLIRIKRELEISLVVNALDITNGTLILSNLEKRKTKLPWDLEDEPETGKQIDVKIRNKLLSRILEDQADLLRKQLKGHPWSGRVLSASHEQIIISAGEEIGISAGRMFNVFERGESIRSVNGETFFLLGEKVGEIKAVKIMKRYTAAVPVTGEDFKAGQIIQVMN